MVAAKSSVVITPSSSAKKRKYLITDPGFGVRYAACLAALAAAIAAASASREATIVITETYDTLQWNLLDAAEGMSLWFLMGMLSSSCCLIQILLGMMSFGCAGFNTCVGRAARRARPVCAGAGGRSAGSAPDAARHARTARPPRTLQ